MDKTRNVFISHYNKDEEHIGKLRDLLGRKGYTIKNSSIDSTKPNRVTNDEAIKRLLRLRIHWAGTFICLIGPRTHTRPWVDWEIEQAHRKGKRIVGIFTSGASTSDIPDNLKLYRNALVKWNTDNIISAIEGSNNVSENPDGSQSEPDWGDTRGTCK